ncbi:alpha/beta fold hydrolase [Sporolactobacillus shoreae]|uniref:Proline iminopeptidase n=1 Tax=Sporolactobacillus shoreae TaxID=1465501 RepID=A0A4Z0GNM1_9BACL|nr:proline iminopeptidase-family hydrolase [Sporolactobacillus shoreae]TGA98510.1 alpha/beta fold hydrolase [Sporolactobacillus shoreae]
MGGQTKILTLKNGYHLWSHHEGKGKIKLLCLHGGPGMTHEYFDHYADSLSELGVEVYTYDQLGSYFSDQPDFTKVENQKLLTIERYVDEVEEVRQLLGLDDFYLLGHSWGGILTQEYALKYGSHLKGAIISSMIDSIDVYEKYNDNLRIKTLGADAVSFMKECEDKDDYNSAQYAAYVDELNANYFCRMKPVPSYIQKILGHTTNSVYNYFQGNNEFIITGALKGWDRRQDVHKITVPVLLLFGGHETMPVSIAEEMNRKIPNARLRICPNGGHMNMFDDKDNYFKALSEFLKDVASDSYIPD